MQTLGEQLRLLPAGKRVGSYGSVADRLGAAPIPGPALDRLWQGIERERRGRLFAAEDDPVVPALREAEVRRSRARAGANGRG